MSDIFSSWQGHISTKLYDAFATSLSVFSILRIAIVGFAKILDYKTFITCVITDQILLNACRNENSIVFHIFSASACRLAASCSGDTNPIPDVSPA